MTTAPSWPDVLSSWSFPAVVGPLAVAATAGYLWLLRRASAARADARVGHWRPVIAWLLGMLALVVAVDGPVGRWADTLFWVHMVQHLLLIMVVPVLVVWARPIRLIRDTRRPSESAARPGRPLRWATAPLTGLVAYSAVVVLTHLTGFQQLSATHPAVRAAELALYVVAGYLFFLPTLSVERGPWSLPHLLRFLLLVLGMGADTLTGVALMLTTRPLAPAYAATHSGWGPTALADQELAGAVMWFGGDLLMMLLIIVVAVQWSRAAAERQGLGDWLEGVRRRAVLAGPAGTDSEGGVEIDDDEDALRSYNAMLADLHRRERGGRGAGRTTP
jgi:putative copper resistance protein D